MKNIAIGLISGWVLLACNSGSSNTPASGMTQYDLQNYSFTGSQTNNCTIVGNSTLNCDSQGTFGGVYKVTFNTPNGVPGAYVVMPPTGDSYGLNIAASGDGCSQNAPESGQTYTCNFTIGVNGTAQAGHTVNLAIDGTLGSATIITINLQ